MKKTVMLIVSIFIVYTIIGVKANEILQIPDEAIRFRVIANSNSEIDQDVKYKVKDEVQKYISTILHDIDTLDASRQVISKNLSNINTKIDSILTKEKYTLPYRVNFGLNYFPAKKYKGINYDEGYYESLVITLGEGKGDNWWCVLFPPLCLLEAEESTEVEYASFVKDLLKKYL